MAKWRDAQGQHQRTLGKVWRGRGRPTSGHLTKQGAQRELDGILAEARRGQLVFSGRPVGGLSFADAAAEWLRYVEHDRKRRPSTIKDYRMVVDNVLVPVFGDAPLEALTSAHVDAFRGQLVAEDRLSARTINKYLALIHGILKRAQRVYGLSANAAAGVERQPVRRSGDFDVLSAEEVEALVRAAVSPQDAAMFATAAFAGLRLGELRALRWRDVDFGKRLHPCAPVVRGARGGCSKVRAGSKRADERSGARCAGRAEPPRCASRPTRTWCSATRLANTSTTRRYDAASTELATAPA